MLNVIWLGLIAVAVLLGGFTGRLGDVGTAAIDWAKTAVTLAFGLVAIMTLWLGLMRLADKAGVVRRLGLVLKPVLVWLFPEVPADHPAMGAILMNMSANILGLNNAATPMGLRAMAKLQSLNRRPGVATNAMCMLLAINTSSITLIPVTVIGLLALNHSHNPTIIIGTSLAATAIAHAAAIGTAKLLERSRFYRLPEIEPGSRLEDTPAPVGLAPTTPGPATALDAVLTDDHDLPWVMGGKAILVLVGALFPGMLLAYAYPEAGMTLHDHLFGSAQMASLPTPSGAPETYTHFLLIRPVQALSLLLVPWLILFFPLYAALRRIPVYEEFVEGGREGFNVMLRILPYIVGMLVAVGMFSASGGMEIIQRVLAPITDPLHFPAELVPLAVIRPFSGTASLALLAQLIQQHGADSPLTLTACTFYGCSETTFYVIAVYFGSVGIRKVRHSIVAGLVADVVGPIASVIVCQAMFGPF